MPMQASVLGRIRHWLFEASLMIKGVNAGAEALAGLGLWLTPNKAFLHLASWLTEKELTQGQDDAMAMWVGHLLQHLSIQTQHFYALYLLAHGSIKLAMVALLQKRVPWAYPSAIVLLLGFASYEAWDGWRSASPTLFALSAFDLFMAVIVWREWLAIWAAKSRGSDLAREKAGIAHDGNLRFSAGQDEGVAK